MLPTIKRSLVIAVIATAGVFASVGTAHAASASRVSLHAVSASNLHGLTSAKNSNILRRGATNFKFKPNAIRVPDCSNPNVTLSFVITNDTRVSQQPEAGGSPIGPAIPAGSAQGYCASAGGGGGFIQINLASSSTAFLNVTVIH